MASCVNISSNEFKDLHKEVNASVSNRLPIPEGVLAAFCSWYMSENDGNFPEASEFLSVLNDTNNSTLDDAFKENILHNIIRLSKGERLDMIVPSELVESYLNMFSFLPEIEDALKGTTVKKLAIDVADNMKSLHNKALGYEYKDGKWVKIKKGDTKASRLLWRIWGAITRIFRPHELGGYGELIAYTILTGGDISAYSVGDKVRLRSSGIGMKDINSNIALNQLVHSQIQRRSEIKRPGNKIVEIRNEFKKFLDGTSKHKTIEDLFKSLDVVNINDDGSMIVIDNEKALNILAIATYEISDMFKLNMADLFSIDGETKELRYNSDFFFLMSQEAVQDSISSIKSKLGQSQDYSKFVENTVANINDVVKLASKTEGAYTKDVLNKLTMLKIELEVNSAKDAIFKAADSIADIIKNISDVMIARQNIHEDNNYSVLDAKKELNDLNELHVQFIQLFDSIKRDYSDLISSNVDLANILGLNSNEKMVFESMVESLSMSMMYLSSIKSGFKTARKSNLSIILNDFADRNELSQEQRDILLHQLDYFFNDVNLMERGFGDSDRMDNMLLQIISDTFSGAERYAQEKALTDVASELASSLDDMVKNSKARQQDMFEFSGGSPTKNFISPYNRGRFADDLRSIEYKILEEINKDPETIDKVTTKDDLTPKQLKKFKYLFTTWRFYGNLEGKGDPNDTSNHPIYNEGYPIEYFRIYDEMNEVNSARSSAIDFAIRSIKNRYLKPDGSLDKVSLWLNKGDRIALQTLERQRRLLGSYYVNGKIKSDEELKNADNYNSVREKLKDLNKTEDDYDSFNEDKLEIDSLFKDGKITKEEYDEWNKSNKFKVNSKSFYDDKLQNLISTSEYTIEKALIAFKRSQLIRIGQVGGDVIEDIELIEEIAKLDYAYSAIGYEATATPEIKKVASDILKEIPNSIKKELYKKVAERQARAKDTTIDKYDFDDIAEIKELEIVAKRKAEIAKEAVDVRNSLFRAKNQIKDIGISQSEKDKISSHINELKQRMSLLMDELGRFEYTVKFGGGSVTRPLSIYSIMEAKLPEDREDKLSSLYIKEREDPNRTEYQDRKYAVKGFIPGDSYRNKRYDELMENDHVKAFYNTLIDKNKMLLEKISSPNAIIDPFSAPIIAKSWRDGRGGVKAKINDAFTRNDDEIQQYVSRSNTTRAKDQSGAIVKSTPMWYRNKLSNMNNMSLNVMSIMDKFAKRAFAHEYNSENYGLIAGIRGAMSDAITLGVDNSKTDTTAEMLLSNKMNVSKPNHVFARSKANSYIEDLLDVNIYGITDYMQYNGAFEQIANTIKLIGSLTGLSLIRTKLVPSATNIIQNFEAMVETAAGDSNFSASSFSKTFKSAILEKHLFSFIQDSYRVKKESPITLLLATLGLGNTKYRLNHQKPNILTTTGNITKGLAHTFMTSGYMGLAEPIIETLPMLIMLSNYRIVATNGSKVASGEDTEFKYEIVNKSQFKRKYKDSNLKWGDLKTIYDTLEESEDGSWGFNEEYLDAIDKSKHFIYRDVTTNMATFSSSTPKYNQGKFYTDRYASALLLLKSWMYTIYNRVWGGIASGPTFNSARNRMEMGFVAYMLVNLFALFGWRSGTRAKINSIFTDEAADMQRRELRRRVTGEGLVYSAGFALLYWALSSTVNAISLASGGDDDDDTVGERLFDNMTGVLAYKLFSEKMFPILLTGILNGSLNKSMMGAYVPEVIVQIISEMISGDRYKTGRFKGTRKWWITTGRALPYSDWWLMSGNTEGSKRYQKMSTSFLHEIWNDMFYGGTDNLKAIGGANKAQDELLKYIAGVRPNKMNKSSFDTLIKRIKDGEEAAGLADSDIKANSAAGKRVQSLVDYKKFEGYTSFKNDHNTKETNKYMGIEDLKWNKLAIKYEAQLLGVKSSNEFKNDDLAKLYIDQMVLKMAEYGSAKYEPVAVHKFRTLGLDSQVKEKEEEILNKFKNKEDGVKAIEKAKKKAKKVEDGLFKNRIEIIEERKDPIKKKSTGSNYDTSSMFGIDINMNDMPDFTDLNVGADVWSIGGALEEVFKR